MKSFKMLAVVGVTALTLSACAGQGTQSGGNKSLLEIARADYMTGAPWKNANIYKASSMQVEGSAFTIALHQEYLDLAAFEYGEDDVGSVNA
ncbi:MAG: hypothetical protein HN578_01590 [Rhodospirillales bacterium]|nr:hypothetical protein [Rhodospirillales bacterium]